MAHIFISYSKKNIAFARHVRHLLLDNGFSVWMDETRLLPGQKWWTQIEQNITTCAAFVVLMSPDSKASRWVQREFLLAEKLNKSVIPVLYQGEAWNDLAETHYADMTAGLNAPLPSNLLDALIQVGVPRNSGISPPPQLPAELIPVGEVNPVLMNGERVYRNPRWWASIRAFLIVGTVALAIAATTFLIVTRINSPTIELTAHPTALTPTSLVAVTSPEGVASLSPTVMATATQSPDSALAMNRAMTTVTNNADWQTLYPAGFVQDFDGVAMVLVPQGCFLMGSDENTEESPIGEQCFDAPFWIDQTEVTQVQFANHDGEKENPNAFDGKLHPVEDVTWLEAKTYCEQRGGRLPTEREWEYAARGVDNLVYPWGEKFVAANAVYNGNATQSVDGGSLTNGKSWVGAYDLAGNVREWVSSLFQRYPYPADDGRATEAVVGNNGTDLRVTRGGSWADPSGYLRSAAREPQSPDYWNNDLGFRCAHS